jgi:hypothetical protein
VSIGGSPADQAAIERTEDHAARPGRATPETGGACCNAEMPAPGSTDHAGEEGEAGAGAGAGFRGLMPALPEDEAAGRHEAAGQAKEDGPACPRDGMQGGGSWGGGSAGVQAGQSAMPAGQIGEAATCASGLAAVHTVPVCIVTARPIWPPVWSPIWYPSPEPHTEHSAKVVGVKELNQAVFEAQQRAARAADQRETPQLPLAQVVSICRVVAHEARQRAANAARQRARRAGRSEAEILRDREADRLKKRRQRGEESAQATTARRDTERVRRSEARRLKRTRTETPPPGDGDPHADFLGAPQPQPPSQSSVHGGPYAHFPGTPPQLFNHDVTHSPDTPQTVPPPQPSEHVPGTLQPQLRPQSHGDASTHVLHSLQPQPPPQPQPHPHPSGHGDPLPLVPDTLQAPTQPQPQPFADDSAKLPFGNTLQPQPSQPPFGYAKADVPVGRASSLSRSHPQPQHLAHDGTHTLILPVAFAVVQLSSGVKPQPRPAQPPFAHAKAKLPVGDKPHPRPAQPPFAHEAAESSVGDAKASGSNPQPRPSQPPIAYVKTELSSGNAPKSRPSHPPVAYMKGELPVGDTPQPRPSQPSVAYVKAEPSGGDNLQPRPSHPPIGFHAAQLSSGNNSQPRPSQLPLGYHEAELPVGLALQLQPQPPLCCVKAELSGGDSPQPRPSQPPSVRDSAQLSHSLLGYAKAELPAGNAPQLRPHPHLSGYETPEGDSDASLLMKGRAGTGSDSAGASTDSRGSCRGSYCYAGSPFDLAVVPPPWPQIVYFRQPQHPGLGDEEGHTPPSQPPRPSNGLPLGARVHAQRRPIDVPPLGSRGHTQRRPPSRWTNGHPPFPLRRHAIADAPSPYGFGGITQHADKSSLLYYGAPQPNVQHVKRPPSRAHPAGALSAAGDASSAGGDATAVDAASAMMCLASGQ